MRLFQEMALCKEVRSLQMVPSYLVQPLKANTSAHLALSQVALLARLLRDLGTDSTGFTVDNVMKVSRSVRLSGIDASRHVWDRLGVCTARGRRRQALPAPPQEARSLSPALYCWKQDL